MTLIKFEKAHDYLDTLNVPRLVEYKSNVIIERIDFTEQENEGNIKWRDDGVYLKIKDNFQRGFMYIKRPDIQKYGLPRFHLLECKTILYQRQNGRFLNHYLWSNSPTVTLLDRATKEEVKDSLLSLCNNCKTILSKRTGESISDTEQFHDLLDLNHDEIRDEIKTDINGYHFTWRGSSRKYRLKQNYTCEECNFGGDDLVNNFDKKYIHTHHIDGNKVDDSTKNLKALCVLCHSKQDEQHKLNFEKRKTKMELRNFIKKYKAKLIEIRNPHIKSFIIENEV